MLIPIGFLLGSIVTSGLIAFCVSELGQGFDHGSYDNPPFCKNIQLASYITTFATTAVATLMICYKTWQYRRMVRRYLDSATSRTRVEKVMILLVESGILYVLFLLKIVIGDSGNINELEDKTFSLEFSNTIWVYMTSHILGIYPAVIVIIVAKQKSYIESATNSLGSTVTVDQLDLVAPNTVRWGASGSQAKFTTGSGSTDRQQSHIVDINMRELQEIQLKGTSVNSV